MQYQNAADNVKAFPAVKVPSDLRAIITKAEAMYIAMMIKIVHWYDGDDENYKDDDNDEDDDNDDNDDNDCDNDEDLRRACYCFPPPALRGDPCGI